jgi:hypothetical protein
VDANGVGITRVARTPLRAADGYQNRMPHVKWNLAMGGARDTTSPANPDLPRSAIAE